MKCPKGTGKRKICLNSTIINEKKDLYLEVNQSDDFVLPNSEYQYEIFIKNTSLSKITDIKLYILNQKAVVFKSYQGETQASKKYHIQDLKPGEAVYLTINDVTVAESGIYTVNFVAYGKNTTTEVVSKKISCGYTKYIPEIYHEISVFNFNPYEESYELSSTVFNDAVNQTEKIQHRPYQEGLQPYKMELNDNYFRDFNDIHGYRVFDQQIDFINKDDFPITYLGREEYISNKNENYKGESLKDLIKKVNQESDLINITYLRNGNNNMKLDFKPLYPKGFMDRFGLLKSEIYQRLGVIPTFSYMNDYLFRWARENDKLANAIYPPLRDDHWDENLWCGYGWYVWEYYADVEEEILTSKELKFFEKKTSAINFIKKIEEWNNKNERNIYDQNGNLLKGYFYRLQESLYSEGVFFVNIPASKIPENFFYLGIDDIKPIIEKTKPYGMRPIIRYIFESTFNHHLNLNHILKRYLKIPLNLGDYNRIKYMINPKQYDIVDDKLVLKNKGFSTVNWGDIVQDLSFDIDDIEPEVLNNLENDMTFETNVVGSKTIDNLSNPVDIDKILLKDVLKEISFKKHLQSIDNPINNIATGNLRLSVTNETTSYIEAKLREDTHCSLDIKRKNPQSKVYLLNSNIFDTLSLKIGDLKNSEHCELSFYFEDLNKNHLFCIEYIKEYDQFLVSYKINKNQNIITKEQFLIPIESKEINIQLIELTSKEKPNTAISTMAILYYKLPDNDLYYLTNVVMNDFSNTDILFRNTGLVDNSAIYNLKNNFSLYNSVESVNKKSKYSIIFSTPKHKICKDIDNYKIDEIKTSDKNWTNLYRIDKNEESYAIIKAQNDNQPVNQFQLYIDSLNIPNESLVEEIAIKCLIDTKINKNVYINCKNNINYMQSNENCTTILKPQSVNIHKNRENSLYNLHRLAELAYDANKQDELNFYMKEIERNKFDNKNIVVNLDNLEENPFLINGKYWSEFDFNNDLLESLKDVSKIELLLEGYNTQTETELISELCTSNENSELINTLIPSGYFSTKINMSLINNITLNNLHCRVKPKKDNDEIKLFNIKLKIYFKNKIEKPIDMDGEKTFNIKENQYNRFIVYNNSENGEFFNNGFLLNFRFDNLTKGDLIRIYALEVEVVYKNTTSRLLISTNSNNNIVLSGIQSTPCYLNGEAFSEQETTSQTKYSDHIGNKYYHGCVLDDSIYQSFIPTDDNITSISIKPNGFYGSPDNNLKLSIYTNANHTPDKKIAETYIRGWNKEYRKDEIISYPIYVEDITPGVVYWFKIEVINKKENNYYWLKSYPETLANNKVLISNDGNLFNSDSCLWYSIQSKQNSKTFNNIPIIIDEINNPYILLKIKNSISEISKLSIREQIVLADSDLLQEQQLDEVQNEQE